MILHYIFMIISFYFDKNYLKFFFSNRHEIFILLLISLSTRYYTHLSLGLVCIYVKIM